MPNLHTSVCVSHWKKEREDASTKDLASGLAGFVTSVNKLEERLSETTQANEGLAKDSDAKAREKELATALKHARALVAETRSKIVEVFKLFAEDIRESCTGALPSDWQTWAVDTPHEETIKERLLDANVLKKMSIAWSDGTAKWTVLTTADHIASLNILVLDAERATKIKKALDDLNCCVAMNFAYKAMCYTIRGATNKSIAKQIIKDTKQKIEKVKGNLPKAVADQLSDSYGPAV